MDDPALGAAQHLQALRGLARLNALSGSASILWPSIARLAAAFPKQSMRVLDIATGAGDVPIALWKRARRAGVRLSIAGCDLSERAVAYADTQAEGAGAEVQFFVHDVLAEPLSGSYDIVTCSLFLHHLDEAQAVHVLRLMARTATQLVLVNDLRRSFWNVALVMLGTQLVSRSAVVHVDSVRSARAALTITEVRALARQAGLAGSLVAPRWPARWLLRWRRT